MVGFVILLPVIVLKTYVNIAIEYILKTRNKYDKRLPYLQKLDSILGNIMWVICIIIAFTCLYLKI